MSTTTNSAPMAIDVRFGSATLEVKLENGQELITPLEQFPRLRNGSPAARLNWRFIGRGEGIHWPDLDVDIAVIDLMQKR